jgi:hypothetical protein
MIILHHDFIVLSLRHEETNFYYEWVINHFSVLSLSHMAGHLSFKYGYTRALGIKASGSDAFSSKLETI